MGPGTPPEGLKFFIDASYDKDFRGIKKTLRLKLVDPKAFDTKITGIFIRSYGICKKCNNNQAAIYGDKAYCTECVEDCTETIMDIIEEENLSKDLGERKTYPRINYAKRNE